MWLIIIMLSITGVDDVDSAKGIKEMPCTHDYQCGEGDCWIGQCVSGGCLGFWKCV